MKSEKTHTQEKKALLYQLEGIVKTFYPSYQTTNPYDIYLKFYYEELVIEDVLLFKRLLKSITLINHKERPKEGNRYISSYGDVLMTIELISQYTVNNRLMNYYVQLKEVFTDRPFTKLQASRVLRKSIRSVERSLKLWKHLKLVKKSNITQGKKHMYELIGYESTSESYDTMFEDYEDYKGYIDLSDRT